MLESVGPELRQYITTNNDEERPFSRDQRRWVYASAKLQNNYFGFGTDNDMEFADGYPIIKHRAFSPDAVPMAMHADANAPIPAAKVLGAGVDGPRSFRPDSVVNVSALSFGSLSSAAIEAVNRGAAAAGCLHNTGEGGLSPYHRNGADIVLQIGTAYFGCRDEQGRFDLRRLKEVVDSAPVKAIEIKLSQGAEPGLGGMLPAAKVSSEIARVREIPRARTARARHGTPRSTTSTTCWTGSSRSRMPPGCRWASSPRSARASSGSTWSRRWPDNATVAFALGCDMVNVAREAMLSIGCIASQRCHSDRCPTGVATQDPWLAHGLDPDLKFVRASNYFPTLRRDLLKISEACGVHPPSLIGTDDVEIVSGSSSAVPLREVYDYRPEWGLPGDADRTEIVQMMDAMPQEAVSAR